MHTRVPRVIGLVLFLVLASGSAAGTSSESDPTLLGSDFQISHLAPNVGNPEVAWTPTDRRYLVVWDDNRRAMGNDVYGRFVSWNGVPGQSEIWISTSAFDESSPAVAFNQTNQQYLVVWQDQRDVARGSEIYGRRLRQDGVPMGTSFRISTSTSNEYDPRVVWNAAANQYLVVWQDQRNDATRGNEVFGRLIGADGVSVGADFRISVSGYDEQDPAVTSGAGSYWVWWQEQRTSENTILGRRVGADGVYRGHFRITSSTFDEYSPAVVWNATANQALVVWRDSRNSATRGYEIFGRRVSATGAVGAEFLISTSTSSEYDPWVVWNATANQYLVVWRDQRNYATRGWEIYGRRVGANGVPVGTDFPISMSTSSEYDPAVVWNQTRNEYLVVWRDERKAATLGWGIFGRRIAGDSLP